MRSAGDSGETGKRMSKTEYKKPSVTVDCVIFNKDNELLLIKRKHQPFQGAWALPGGFADENETVEQAAVRELEEETSLIASKTELLGVYSKPGRDPRGWTISVAFLIPEYSGKALAQDDASALEFRKVTDDLFLAFDHVDIVRDGLARLGT